MRCGASVSPVTEMFSPLLTIIVALAWLLIGVGGWLGWQLLRQNGRMLLRLDELEKRLKELEFGETDQPEGLPIGSEAPAFELPDLAGEQKSLARFRGQPLLVIFFNPDCGFCREMAPKLAALRGVRRRARQAERDAALVNGFNPSQSAVTAGTLQGDRGASSDALPTLLIITTGDVEKNRQFFARHKLAFPVLLQKQMEVVTAYQATGTPTGYLINAEGKITSSLVVGADPLLALANGSPHPQPLSHPTGEGGPERGEEERATRFGNRSLARSKIKRDGLKAGTPAPDFRLPRLDGQGDLALQDLRGSRVLLVFSDPHCGPCQVLAPELEKFHRENSRNSRPPSPRPSPPGEGEPASIQVVMISRGEPKENRLKVKEHGLTFPVLLQQRWEISRLYAMFATPVAYLIDEAGIIAHDVAVGLGPILRLLVELPRSTEPVAKNSFGDFVAR